MIEVIKDILKYLKINQKSQNLYGHSINSIVAVNMPMKFKKTKKIKKNERVEFNMDVVLDNNFEQAYIPEDDGQIRPRAMPRMYFTQDVSSKPSSKYRSPYSDHSNAELEDLLNHCNAELKSQYTDTLMRSTYKMKISMITDELKRRQADLIEKEVEVIDKLKLVQDFYSYNGYWPALIKGVVLSNSKLITDPDAKLSMEDMSLLKPGRVEYICKVAYVEDGVLKFKLFKTKQINTIDKETISTVIPLFIKAKLVTTDKSIDVFGSKSDKQDLKDLYLDNYQVYFTRSKKLNDSGFILQTVINGKKLKFVLQDFEFINHELKGYNLAKYFDYTIGKKVLHKETNIEGHIISIKSNNSSKRISKSNLKRLDIVTIRTSTGNILPVRASTLKLIEEDVKKTNKPELPF